MDLNPTIHLEEVFKTSGIPTYTYVDPQKYPELILNLRTPGRGLVIEGPSGIGKTTAVETALQKLNLPVTRLSARKPDDIEYIQMLPKIKDVGVVLIDDFHRLPTETRTSIADLMKVLADTETKETKIIVLGINRAAENLIQIAPDLVNRIDVIRFESEPDSKIYELIQKGGEILNVSITVKDDIVESAKGSFYLAQLLCREVCLASNILHGSPQQTQTTISFEAVRANVWDRLGMSFKKRCELFCTGTRLRKTGRAPYLYILNWLAMGKSWTLDLRQQLRIHTNLKLSVSQIIDKGYLSQLIDSSEELRQVFYYDERSKQLTVEDPQFLFYIRNIPWHQFSKDLGYISIEFERRYDFALSFAGSDRDIAEKLFLKLSDNELEVFYDKNEQHRILAKDVEEYLRPIYQSEAQYIIVLLGIEYPHRIWTKIESDAFGARFGEDSVIPIWFSDVPSGMFDVSKKKGGFTFNRDIDISTQIDSIVELLLKKLEETRLPSTAGFQPLLMSILPGK